LQHESGPWPTLNCCGDNILQKGVVFTKRADIEAKTETLVMPIIEANNLELVDVEYVKEGSDYYLRVYADKEGGITIGDCEIVNQSTWRPA